MVTKFGDKAINDSDDLVGAVQAGKVGDRVEVQYKRNGSAETGNRDARRDVITSTEPASSLRAAGGGAKGVGSVTRRSRPDGGLTRCG